MIGVSRKNTVAKIRERRGRPAGSAIPRTPQRSPQRRTAVSKNAFASRKSKQEEQAEIHDQFGAVIQDVVTHLVGHDFANFRERALLEQIIVQRDSSRAEKTGDVRADAIRLARRVNFEDLGHRNLVRPRHGENRFADRRIGERLVGVKERFDVNRRRA